MSFLAPALLLALPLAALPIIIHLVHLYRRRRVKWAAMIFLVAAQRMNKGLSRLRQILILALRALAVAAIILVVARPLAGGWLGLTGGAPDTVLILVDRSASMSQKNTATGTSKLTAGLRNIAKAINDAVGLRSHLVLIDSARAKPQPLDRADALLTVPQTEQTDTAADIPGLLQAALDYITTNKTGRTDVWILSDLQRTDWDADGGRWETLRNAFASLHGVRFHLLCYPQPAPDDLAVTIDHVQRVETPEKTAVVLDLRIVRHAADPQPIKVPLTFVINGTATTTTVDLRQNELAIEGYTIPIDRSLRSGWGRVELPADSSPANDKFYFVFDQPPPLHSVIVSDDDATAAPIDAALSAAADSEHKYVCTVLGSSHAAEIPWDDTALIVWNAALPKPGDVLAKLLRDFLANGRTILFLPPESPDDTKIFDLGWTHWQEESSPDKPMKIDWWRNDDDLLANTRDGSALPVGKLEVLRACGIAGDGVPLARITGFGPLLVRSLGRNGNAYFLGMLPGSSSSSLARDGVVMFALLNRALNQGVATLGKAQQRYAAANALGDNPAKWHRVDPSGTADIENLPLRAGVYATTDRLAALNRPPSEDQPQTLSTNELDELFAGLDFHVMNDTLESGRSLTNEVWRTFLILVALALIGEALLCMPVPRDPAGKKTSGFAPSKPAEPTAVVP